MIRTHTNLLSKLATLAGVVFAVALALPAGASALSNGDPCPPYWTEASAPTASFTFAPSAPLTYVSVGFDATSSTEGTAFESTVIGGDGNKCEEGSTAENDPIAYYTWAFGDGTTETDTVATTSHFYSKSGHYTVTLTVQEANGHTANGKTTFFTNTTTHTVTIANRPPIASFAAPTSLMTGQVANFDASSSVDPDGYIANYHWDFGDGNTLDTTNPTTAHIYSTSGAETVTLTVTDSSGATAQSQHTVDAINRPPIASFTAPSGVSTGQSASFDASASADPDGTIVAYHWVFGDGHSADTTIPTVSHVYGSPGLETVTLTVTDNDGSTGQAQRTIHVQAANSGQNGGSGQSGTAGQNGNSGQNGNNGQNGTGATAAKCVVPKLNGDKLVKAEKALTARHCKLGKIRHQFVRKHSRRGHVVAQTVRPRKDLPSGSTVGVTIGK